MAFPTTQVLDNFNRANEGPPPSASWVSTGIIEAVPSLRVVSNTMADDGSFSGGAWGTQFGSDCEVYLTVTTLMVDGGTGRLLLRSQQIGSSATLDAYMLIFERSDATTGFIFRYYRFDNGAATQLGSDILDTSGVLSPGVKFGFEAIGDTLTAYVNRSGTWVAADPRTDATYSAGGYVGFYSSESTGRYNGFGGGTIESPGPIGSFPTARMRSRRTSW